VALKSASYLEEAKRFLERAKEELKKGDIRQATEKVWGAAALAIKAHASAKSNFMAPALSTFFNSSSIFYKGTTLRRNVVAY